MSKLLIYIIKSYNDKIIQSKEIKELCNRGTIDKNAKACKCRMYSYVTKVINKLSKTTSKYSLVFFQITPPRILNLFPNDPLTQCFIEFNFKVIN